jgi:hypothetical protein
MTFYALYPTSSSRLDASWLALLASLPMLTSTLPA